MSLLYNLARMTTGTTGFGSIVLGSAATVNGIPYLTFAQAGVTSGDTVSYAIADINGSEIGTGVVTGLTMTRTVTRSTNANSAINLSGAAQVFISPRKEDIANLLQNNTFTGTQTITPTSGTLNQGLVVTQTWPNTGTPVGPILGNQFDVTNPGIGATGTNTWDAFGIRNLLYGSRFTMSVTGASVGAGSAALAGITNLSAGSDGFGGTFGLTVTGTNPTGHNAWGAIGYAIGFSNSSIGLFVALEGEIGVSSSGFAQLRVGVSANSQGPTQGAALDTAFACNVSTGNIPGSVGASAQWQHLMTLSNSMYAGGFPLTTTGDFFFSDIAGTTTHFANLSNVTITGSILSFPFLNIAGNGGAFFGSNNAPSAGQVFVKRTSGGQILLQSVLNATNGVTAVVLNDVSTNNIAVLGVGEAANTQTRFGQTLANFVEVIGTGSTNVGLLVGTVGANPLIFGSNDTFSGQLTGGQLWYLGTTKLVPAAGTTLTVSQNTGGTPATSAIANIVGQFIAADAAIALVTMDTFGAQGFFANRYATGTQNAKTATGGTINTFSFGAQGWNGSAYVSGALIDFITTATAWSAGVNTGMSVRVRTTPDGSTGSAEALRIWGSGGLSVATANDPGSGMIYTNAATFMIRTKTSYTNGAAATSPTLGATGPAGATTPTKWIAVDDNGTTRQIPAW